MENLRNLDVEQMLKRTSSFPVANLRDFARLHGDAISENFGVTSTHSMLCDTSLTRETQGRSRYLQHV